MSYLLGLESSSRNTERTSRTTVHVFAFCILDPKRSGNCPPPTFPTSTAEQSWCYSSSPTLSWNMFTRIRPEEDVGVITISETGSRRQRWSIERYIQSSCPCSGEPVGKLLHPSNPSVMNLDGKQTLFLITTLKTQKHLEKEDASGVLPLWLGRLRERREERYYSSASSFPPRLRFFIPFTQFLWRCPSTVRLSVLRLSVPLPRHAKGCKVAAPCWD